MALARTYYLVVSPVDPRVLRTRSAVSTVVVQIFQEEGVAGLTHQRVAARAGVGRATVYRHWPTQIDLASEALSKAEQPMLRYDDMPIRDWLRRELTRIAEVFSLTSSRNYIAFLITSDDVPTRELREALVRRAFEVVNVALDRAIRVGELSSKPNPEVMVGQLIGTLIMRVAIETSPVGSDYLEALIDSVFAGCE